MEFIDRGAAPFIQCRKVKDKNKTKIWDASLDRQPKIQSSSVEETIQRILAQTNNDCRFWISTLTSSPTPATFACWKIRFKTEVCTCSQFPTEAMQWIKEVEMVDSVDDLRSSSSIRGISMPNFEVLDARIASALNEIIHTSHFKRRISLEEQKAQKQDRFLRGRQIAYLIYEYFRVTGIQRFCRELCRFIYSCVFEMTIFRSSIQNVTKFYYRWHKSHLMTSWKACTIKEYESEKLKTSGSLEPTILSRTMPTCSLLVIEMTIFWNSIQSGTQFYCRWQKNHLMTSWKDRTK